MNKRTTMTSIRLLPLLVFALQATFVSAQYKGSMYDPATQKSVDVSYTVTESHTNDFYFSTFKIFDAAKKKILYEVSLTNDKQNRKLIFTLKDLITETKQLDYNTATSGLFYSNNSLQDASIEISSLANPAFEYILSFSDTLRNSPAIHKFTTPTGNIVFLDEIKLSRLARHKAVFAERQEDQKTVTLLKQQQEQEFARLAAEKQRADSIQKAKTQLEQQHIYDSLQTELFQRDLVKEATSFYNQWQADMMKAQEMQSSILSSYSTASSENKLHDTRIENEWYAGGFEKRRKQGSGISIVKTIESTTDGKPRVKVTYRDGIFNADTFQSGKIFIHDLLQKYVGEFAWNNKSGFGKLLFADGNYLLGNFFNNNFEEGTSFWSNPKTRSVYFGQYANGHQTGFGEMHSAADTIAIGKFVNSNLTDGYYKSTDPSGKITYGKRMAAQQKQTSEAEALQFFSAMDELKKKYPPINFKKEEIALPAAKAIDTIPSLPEKKKFKVPHYVGVTLGTCIPVFGFNNQPTYALLGAKFSVDGWFRMANQIGFKVKIGTLMYSINDQYSSDVNSDIRAKDNSSTMQIRELRDVFWFIHYYNAGLGLNLGGKVASLEMGATAGLAVIHEPIYEYEKNEVFIDKGRVNWNIQGQLSMRFNCTKTFSFRFGAEYFYSQVTNFKGYTHYNGGWVREDYLEKFTDNPIGIHSIDPFISFVGMF